MPQIFKVGRFTIYFWFNEGIPLEPIHVHVSEGVPTPNATKIWLTKDGNCILCNNNSNIPPKQLKIIQRVIRSRYTEIIDFWYSRFGSIHYYC